MTTLNLIGCGAVGRTLGRLLNEARLCEVRDILTRSAESGTDGTLFIGAGRPVRDYAQLAPAELYLIAVPDDAIAGCAERLAASGRLRAGCVVCHLSGALSSSVLAPVAAAGARIASLHPVRSFADPLRAVQDFPGTWCAAEGDSEALELLQPIFGALGAQLFPIDPAFKSVYHAGAVLACNYLPVLVELGLRAFGRAGVGPEVARQVLEPLVSGTVDNIFRMGTAGALSGPIARGDLGTVTRQLAALSEWDPSVAELYRQLGLVALELSGQKEGAPPQRPAKLGGLLENGPLKG
ncbi:oxidoreductase [Geomonas silvestris]|uniref:Oxidoreductase n=1 Tax=Geomonas silvestris TaxID=2740184 RepID=A0A6V8MM87_9BACT|nr:Rossmann-like and DUF2520 domain-containing protein [Geomonas silvestris]GFO60759.1 oxidoreductase [Geomonas silvestris]